MNHARALGNAADAALDPADLKADGDLLELGVGRHNALGRKLGAVAERGNQRRDTRRDGGDVERLTDNAGRCDNDVVGLDVELLCQKVAHLPGNFDAVCIAGVGVAAVADDCLRLAVSQVLLGDDKRSALDEVGRVDRRRVGFNVADDERKVALILIFAYAAVYTRGLEALCRANAAVYYLHFIFLRYMSSP